MFVTCQSIPGDCFVRSIHNLSQSQPEIARRKIEIDPAKPAVIRTIRGGGYLFSPTGDKA